ncbi:hypothetical protein [Streptococcus dysgalactiae]|uniref:hypothetical protein n=1 Tax=Streptococcus dysgalactiae TaxID=1334 RepID=UPI001CF22559|nr:hypothetical protein [Streptococcus dysgalactiae]MCB2844006.1 hypothetical protein [Streptococcus dysgalactiae subsp. dysgalactiae]
MVQKSLYTSSYTSLGVKEVTKTLSFGSNTTLAKMQKGELYIKHYSVDAYYSDDLLDFYYTDGNNIWYFKSRKSQAWDDYGLLTGTSSSSSGTSSGLKVSKNGKKEEGRLQRRWTVWHINSDGSTDDTRVSASEMITFEPYVKNTDIEDYNNGNVVNIFFIDNDGAIWTFNANKKYVIKRMSVFVPEQSKDNVADFRGVTAVIYNKQTIQQIVYNHEVVWSKLIKPITVNELSIQVQNNSASIIIYERNYSLSFFRENYSNISSLVIDGNNYKVTEQLQMSDRGTFLIIYGPVDGQSFDRANKTVTFKF